MKEKFPAPKIDKKLEKNFNPEIIEKIEHLDFLDAKSRGELLLVLEGLKPAILLNIWHVKGKDDEKKFQQSQKLFEDVLRASKLPYRLEKEETEGWEGSVIQYANFFVGKDEGTVESLVQADKIENPKERDAALGEALGYPSTVIEAFKREDFKNRDELPDDVKRAEELDFLPFRLSNDHWREEFELVKKWAQTIKESVPDLYKKITSSKD